GELGGMAAIALVAALATGWLRAPDLWAASTRLWILLIIFTAALAATRLPRLQLVLVGVSALFVMAALGHGYLYSGRSFFGVHRVVERGFFRMLYHGTPMQGAQRVRGLSGTLIALAKLPLPAAYSPPASTHVIGLELMRRAFHDGGRPRSVGIIGL